MLCILDGWGLRDDDAYNAVRLARTPTADALTRSCAHATLLTSGENVGLPPGQMGNSEVGHMNLGAGRIVYQDLLRIDRAVQMGELAANSTLLTLRDRVVESGGALHLMGLVSDGGVHASDKHLVALLDLARQWKLRRVVVHAFTDGRDTPPNSGLGFIQDLQEALSRLLPEATIGTVSGRYFAMDRDHRWPRTKLAYDALVYGRGEQASSATEAVEAAYQRGETDEFIRPTVCGGNGARIQTGDAVLFFNFRSDRARQLTEMLGLGWWPDALPIETPPKLADYVTLTQYKDRYGLPVVFPPQSPSQTLGEVVAAHSLKQLRCAETEKYAHVTFFFNGGREAVFDGEERRLVQSPQDVATYDLKPEMSAAGVTGELLAAIASQAYSLIVCNYANPDMVGHCGKLDAAITAVQKVDQCLGELVAACKAAGVTMLVTADHGNCETMWDETTGGPHTAHTTNPVPIWLVEPGDRTLGLRSGILADVAPTLLQLMGLPQPDVMTGRSLLVSPG